MAGVCGPLACRCTIFLATTAIFVLPARFRICSCDQLLKTTNQDFQGSLRTFLCPCSLGKMDCRQRGPRYSGGSLQPATSVDNDELRQFLLEEGLERFYTDIRDKLLITRVSHLRYATGSDLESVGLSKPSVRRLLQRAKKHKHSRYMTTLKKVKQWFQYEETFTVSKVVRAPQEGRSNPSFHVPPAIGSNVPTVPSTSLGSAVRDQRREAEQTRKIPQSNPWKVEQNRVVGDLIDLNNMEIVRDLKAASIMLEEQSQRNRYESIEETEDVVEDDSEESLDDFDSELAELVADINLNMFENKRSMYVCSAATSEAFSGSSPSCSPWSSCSSGDFVRTPQASAPERELVYGTWPSNDVTEDMVQKLMATVKVASRPECIRALKISANEFEAAKVVKINQLLKLGLAPKAACETALRNHNWDLNHAASALLS